MPSSRRSFLQQTGQLTAGLGLAPALSSLGQSAPRTSAADTVSVALIGYNSMGWADLTSMLRHPGVTALALCDVDQNVLNRRAAELEKLTGKKPRLYGDFRKLLESKDIDAVIVGTPDHWHCLPTVLACEAGKDVYVEKPLANSIEECNLMAAAAKRYNRIVQVGQWQRSGPHWQAAFDFIRGGGIGTVRSARTWAFMEYGRTFPVRPDEPVPAGVDYDMWLGPAPKRPFNRNRFHGSFRYFWDYAGGLMTDWGVHMIDMVMACMKVGPARSVVAMGGKFGFPEHASETPDTLQALYDFGSFSMIWEQSLGTGRGPYDRDHGVAFTGNLGTVVIDRGKWELFPETESGRYLTAARPPQRGGSQDLNLHTLNFVECIRSRKQPNCPAEVGRDVAINAQMGNIAYRLGRKVSWDADRGSFGNDNQANELAKAHYHGSWQLPRV